MSPLGKSYPIASGGLSPIFDLPLSQSSYNAGYFMDYGPNGRDGTVLGGGTPTFATGPDGVANSAAVFNGSYNIDISVLSPDVYNLNSGSISFWLKSSTYGDVIWKVGTSGYPHIVATTNNQILIRYLTANDGVTNLSVVGALWHHIVVVQDGSEQKIYQDSSLLSNTYSTGYWFDEILGSSDPITIGGNPGYAGSGPYEYNGSLYKFKIYDIALTQEQVTTLYNNKE